MGQYRSILISLFLLAFSVSASAGTVSGIFRTEVNDSGAFLEVEFAPCESDENLSCATILKAYKSKNDINKSYEHLGKIIVAGMEDVGGGKFKSGTIWDPSEDKTYNSKMSIKFLKSVG